MNKSDFEVIFDQDKFGYFIRIRSLLGGKHYAIHRTYEECTDSTSVTKNITLEVKDLLLDNIKKFGVTEGFILNRSNNKSNDINIRHLKTNSEINFTSTGEKLYFHHPIFTKLSHTGYSSIIRATMTLHQVCASKCHFCSTINRNRKDSISLEEAKSFVEKLYFDQAKFNAMHFPEYNKMYKEITNSDIRLRGLILSGGGQPNLWPHFEEFVEWLSELEIDLGLITNGFPEKVNEKIYKNFKWIRLSITPEDASPFYPNKKFDLQYIPEEILLNKNIKFGLSYVYGTWTSNDIIKRLVNVIDKWSVDYIRFLTDCNLGREQQLLSHKRLADKLFSLNLIDQDGKPLTKIFHQLKFHGNQEEANSLWDEGKCYLQTYNVFWDTTGHEENGYSYCYPCDSVTVLTSDEKGISSERGFNYKKWGTVTSECVDKLFKDKWISFFDPRENCSSCLFMKNNQVVKNLIKSDQNLNNKIMLVNSIEHVNFP